MTRKLFGTDGIRGQANSGNMTAETALRVAMAAARQFRRGDHRHVVVIGKDTRLSGYMLEPALTAGFTSMGMDVVLVGPIPTPAIGMLTWSLRADLGVMLSASHNPYEDNGIKLFGPDGYKLSDEIEEAIERSVARDNGHGLVEPSKLGRARRLDDASGRYIHSVKNSLPRRVRLDGLRVVIDCAHGAAYKIAPAVLYELGAEVIKIGVDPDGFNINRECGATATKAMCQAVQDYRADIGIALDGDADRVMIADEKGKIVDGDQLMALIATDWHKQERLTGGGIVATVMSNLGLEKYLNGMGLELARTSVGDRYVVEHMRKHDFNLGGEQSGHIVLRDFATTGDGLVAGLQVLAAMVERGRPASEVCHMFEPFPQKLRNIRYPVGTDPMQAHSVQQAIGDAEKRLNGSGRVLIRKSGTEPLIRVMVESRDEELVISLAEELAGAIQAAGEAARTAAE